MCNNCRLRGTPYCEYLCPLGMQKTTKEKENEINLYQQNVLGQRSIASGNDSAGSDR